VLPVTVGIRDRAVQLVSTLGGTDTAGLRLPPQPSLDAIAAQLAQLRDRIPPPPPADRYFSQGFNRAP
jgi:hypothetical protein